MNDILFRSATEVADLLRRRQVSSRELTERLLARIDAVNPRLNAVVELRREAAFARAEAADAALAGAAEPLLGLPITIKDSFNVAGMHTTWGNPAFKDFVAHSDATVVQRLEQAGAITVGKTNVAFMLADFAQTANPVYGVTNNPWDITRTPGGSTGGGAAALAAGMTFLDYGTDLVGSIRIPASFCGVYGLKPSARLVPLTGFQLPGTPPTHSEMRYMSAVGPLARSAADLRLALQLTAGPEPPESAAFSWRLPPPRHSRLDRFRVGLVLDDPNCPVSSEVGAVLSNLADALARAGVHVTRGWPDGVDPKRDVESFGFQVQAFFAFQDPSAGGPSLAEFAQHEMHRMASRAVWTRYFQDVDVFICPTNFTPAFPHDDRPFQERTTQTPEGERRYEEQPFWIAHASLSGLPSLSAPIGRTREGLPVGAQIIGPLYEDDTAITFAELLTEVACGYEVPPL
jgi:amidase